MPKRLHSTLILVAVFTLGIAGGAATMVWAWPGLRQHYFPRHRQTFAEYLQKSLSLTPSQAGQVQTILTETGKQGHQIHLEFMPAYTKLCDDYMSVRSQERSAFAPIRQQSMDKLHAVLNSQQWQTFEEQNAKAAKESPQRTPDICRHLSDADHGSPAHPSAPRRH